MGNACKSDDVSQCRVEAETIIASHCNASCSETVHSPCEKTIAAIMENDESLAGPSESIGSGIGNHAMDESTRINNAVHRIILTSQKPWPPETHAMVRDRWFRHGGMPRVMEEYYHYHMTMPEGVLNEMRLTRDQMAEVQHMLEASGELEQILEDKIKSSMSQEEINSMRDERIRELICDDCKYGQWSTIKAALDDDGVALLRGDWVVTLSQKPDSRLARRQELPDGSLWIQKDLKDRLGHPERKAIAIVAVSYCWRSPTHPDPDGDNLHLLAALLQEFARQSGPPTWHGEVGVYRAHEWDDLWQPVGSVSDVAIFFDWCSLYQNPRSAVEEMQFAKALKDIDIWFTHRGTHVWMFTSLPEGVFTSGNQNSLDSPYGNRGWPTFEHHVSTLIKDSGMVFDMGKLPPLWRIWHDVSANCRPTRVPPKNPSHFADELRTKQFMLRSDCRLLIERYEKAYNSAICKAKELNFGGIIWNPHQLMEIGAMLPQCFQLQSFMFHDSLVGNEGGAVLARALPLCPTLEQLHLWRACLGDKCGVALSQALPNCRSLQHLCLQFNEIGDTGAQAIACCLQHTLVSVLRLDKNQISNAGAQCFVDAFQDANKLLCLVICYNSVDELRKQSLEAAWQAAGKASGKLAKQWMNLHLHEQIDFDTTELEKYGGIIV